jgi:hypothetical protein
MKPEKTTAPIAMNGRLLAVIVRGLLAREDFESVASLTEALKVECGRLKIRWSNDAIADAYRLIESNRPLSIAPRPTRPPCVKDGAARPFSREEATDLCERLRVACRREAPGGPRA